MEKENQALLEKLEGITQDLTVTQQQVETLKEINASLRSQLDDKELTVTRLKAKLYDVTVGVYF